MSEIFQANKEIAECKCKQLCIRMRNSGLKCYVEGLKKLKNNSNTIKKVLLSIENLLDEYYCLPCDILKKRSRYIYERIIPGDSELYEFEEVLVNAFIKELETFIEDANIS